MSSLGGQSILAAHWSRFCDIIKTNKGVKMDEEKKLRRLEVFLEFFVFGVIFGVIEDLIAVKLSTGEAITWRIIGIIVLVAVPFAVIGELIVDRIDFVKFFKARARNKKLKTK